MKIAKTKKAVLFTQTSVSNRVCLDRAYRRFVSSRARKKIMQPLKAQKKSVDSFVVWGLAMRQDIKEA